MSWEIFEEQHVTLWDWRCIDHVGMGDRSACTYILRTTTVVTNMPMSCMMNRVEGGSTFYSRAQN